MTTVGTYDVGIKCTRKSQYMCMSQREESQGQSLLLVVWNCNFCWSHIVFNKLLDFVVLCKF